MKTGNWTAVGTIAAGLMLSLPAPWGPGEARASEPEAVFLDAVRGVASEILQAVEGKLVMVGPIEPIGKLRNANSGAALSEALKSELRRLKPGSVRDDDAPVEIRGEFLLGSNPSNTDTGPNLKGIKLIFRIIDTATGDDSKLSFQPFIKDNTTIATVAGVSGSLSLAPDKTQGGQKIERNKEIAALIDNPSTFVDPSRPSLVSTSAASPFRVEILAGPLGDRTTRPTAPRPARVEKGLAFVEIDRDEVYEIRIHNASPDEVAARVTVDGVDVFHFSDDRNAKNPKLPRLTHFIVQGSGGESALTVPGWHKSTRGEENFLAFLVTDLGKGVSSKGVAAQGSTGVIQVQFSRCRPLGDGNARGGNIETGFGPPRRVGQKEIAREIDPPTEIVSLRYSR